MTRRIVATAPIRICDCGGWTDTWFARHGAVCHIAVEPVVRVEIIARPGAGGASPVMLHAENLGNRYAFVPGTRPFVKHPLLEAAIESVGIPTGQCVEIRVASPVPPGASTGTSASVCVALLGALNRLWERPLDPLALARAAHAVEVDRLGQQSGVQDQLAAASGGVNFIEIDSYPHATVHPLLLSEAIGQALDARLMLIYLGRTHRSSAVHDRVIYQLTDAGPEHPALDDLRGAAHAARDALVVGNLDAFGAAMIANTEAQRRLHPSLVGARAQRAIDIASAFGAVGWKVNGAGGEGGSVTVLCGPDWRVAGGASRVALGAALTSDEYGYTIIPIATARRGLSVSADEQDALGG